MKKKSSGIGVGVFQVLADLPGGDPAVIAQRAEALGFDSYWLPEHAIIPEGSADVYPGKKAEEPPPDYLFRMPDPLIALSRAAATTREIRLGTGVALVPERNAMLAAKEIATLDHYSGGRFVYGIGAGWNEAECTVMGGDFARRWTQTGEAIQVMKKLWTGEYQGHAGKYYNFPPSICLPRPTQRPHPPILLGSIGSPNVYRRVAEWGDGWLPFVVDPAELTEGKAEIRRYAEKIGRNPAEIEICAFAAPGLFRSAEGIKALADAGADSAVVWLDGHDQREILASLESLAREFFG